jgi:Arabinose efflux permease
MNRAGRTVYPILLMVCATHLLNDMMQSVIPAVYPLLKEKFGFTFAQIGLITLVFQLTSSLLQPVAGRLADLHPRPYSLAAGMCFTLCGLLALAAAPGFALILVSVGLIGCGSSVFHPESSRVAQLASGGRKGLAQSIFQVGGNAGSAMGPLLAALIVIPFGQASIGWFALAALLAIFILVKIGNWYKRQLALAARRPAVAADTTGPGLSKRKFGMRSLSWAAGFLEVFLHRLDDQLFHLFPDGQILDVGAGSAVCAFRFPRGFGGGDLHRRAGRRPHRT